mmetsp:Transcript_31581/g.31314  ORF Transcript_31581/g.31314 Transcript_31581/m.31314 type:complete len:81 (-) Transcript_31581:836-1078(-)
MYLCNTSKHFNATVVFSTGLCIKALKNFEILKGLLHAFPISLFKNWLSGGVSPSEVIAFTHELLLFIKKLVKDALPLGVS